MNNYWRLSFAIAALIGAATGSIFLWIGLDHNAQSELVSSSGDVDIWQALIIFGSWAIIASAIVTGIAFLVHRISR